MNSGGGRAGDIVPTVPAEAAASEHASRKQRGAFYTPPAMASFLADWVIADDTMTVIEPAAGEGALALAASARLSNGGRVDAVEVDAAAAAVLRQRAHASGAPVVVHQRDFLRWFVDDAPLGVYDAAIGNPPFLRASALPADQRAAADWIVRSTEAWPTRQYDASVAFLVASIMGVRPEGTIGFVLPTGVLHTTYGTALQGWLGRRLDRIEVIRLGGTPFDGALQHVALLRGRVSGRSSGRRTFRTADLPDMSALTTYRAPGPVPLPAAGDWSSARLSSSARDVFSALSASGCFVPLDTHARVTPGIATGDHRFFLVSSDTVRKWQIQRWVVPAVPGARHLPGMRYLASDWQSLRDSQQSAYLFAAPRDALTEPLPAALGAYIAHGERLGSDRPYKSRTRPRWWRLPEQELPDGFVVARYQDAPRLVVNESAASCTSSLYRVHARHPDGIGGILATMSHSFAAVWAELRGSPQGGGAMYLVPSVVSALPAPASTSVDPSESDAAFRLSGMEAAMDVADAALVADHGLARADLSVLRDAWRDLRAHRVRRRAPQTRI